MHPNGYFETQVEFYGARSAGLVYMPCSQTGVHLGIKQSLPPLPPLMHHLMSSMLNYCQSNYTHISPFSDTKSTLNTSTVQIQTGFAINHFICNHVDKEIILQGEGCSTHITRLTAAELPIDQQLECDVSGLLGGGEIIKYLVIGRKKIHAPRGLCAGMRDIDP